MTSANDHAVDKLHQPMDAAIDYSTVGLPSPNEYISFEEQLLARQEAAAPAAGSLATGQAFEQRAA